MEEPLEVQTKLTGVAASEGVTIGPVFVHDPGELKPERETISEGTVEEELARFEAAAETVVAKLSETAEKMREAGNEDEAAIFDAHIELSGS